MKFTKDEIRKAMLLYAVTDQMWLKEGEALVEVVESVLKNGATFLQIREKDLAENAFEAEAERLKTLCAQHGNLNDLLFVSGSDAHYLWDIRDANAYFDLEDEPYSGDFVRHQLFLRLKGGR